MPQAFKTIALLGKVNQDSVNQTMTALYEFLIAHHYEVIVESRVAKQLAVPKQYCLDIVDIGKMADLTTEQADILIKSCEEKK